MTSLRARANQSIYLARILLDSWRDAEEQAALPVNVLNQAFLPAVREHLVDAYGWFLLQLAGQEGWSGAPPRCCAELPAVEQGKALPGELQEFQQMERNGWLQTLLESSPELSVSTGSRAAGALTLAPAAAVDRALAQAWATDLEALFERMSDSLDEC